MKEIMFKTLKVLKNAKDKDSRADIIFDLPDSRIYADYYTIIKEPIAIQLILIESRVNASYYTSISDFQKDLEHKMPEHITRNQVSHLWHKRQIFLKI